MRSPSAFRVWAVVSRRVRMQRLPRRIVVSGAARRHGDSVKLGAIEINELGLSHVILTIRCHSVSRNKRNPRPWGFLSGARSAAPERLIARASHNYSCAAGANMKVRQNSLEGNPHGQKSNVIFFSEFCRTVSRFGRETDVTHYGRALYIAFIKVEIFQQSA